MLMLTEILMATTTMDRNNKKKYSEDSLTKRNSLYHHQTQEYQDLLEM